MLCDACHIYQIISESEFIPVGATVVVTANPMDFEQENPMGDILTLVGVSSLAYAIALLRVSFGA
ncbi:MAG: hypothetical protein BMS9Abin18_0846 [Zetaproteobacteria bacterium]|nr:MAG: hypothetical protein BMS9Abin18_0846 [Zetaproteobacteria bacterium]